jgi:hypothetical protein
MADATSGTPAATADTDEDQLDATVTDEGTEPEEETEPDPEGADQLGDPGKKALASMKDRLKAERQQRRDLQAELDKLRNGAKKDDGAPDMESVRRDAEKAATEKANARIVRSEIRAAAAGKLADPKDALTFLDLTQFEVDDNGEVDSDEIADAIEDLLKRKPYLAAATAKRFQGTGDGGAARKPGKPKQLTETDLKTMTPEQIVKAQDEGRLTDLLGTG